MSEPESVIHSFIIKIWLEAPLLGSNKAIWRGHITHVPNGERRYLRRLSDIDLFIARYLAEMGASLDPLVRVRLWFDRNIGIRRGRQ